MIAAHAQLQRGTHAATICFPILPYSLPRALSPLPCAKTNSRADRQPVLAIGGQLLPPADTTCTAHAHAYSCLLDASLALRKSLKSHSSTLRFAIFAARLPISTTSEERKPRCRLQSACVAATCSDGGSA